MMKVKGHVVMVRSPLKNVKKSASDLHLPQYFCWRVLTENEDIQLDYVEKETNADQIQEESLNITPGFPPPLK